MYYLYVAMDNLTLQVVTPTEAWLSLDEIISIYIGGGGGVELSVSLLCFILNIHVSRGHEVSVSLSLYVVHSICMFLEGMKFPFLFLYM